MTEVRDYPFTPTALVVDPLLGALREQEPVSRVRLPFGGAAWLVTRYADVRTVLSDPRFKRGLTVGKDTPRATEPIEDGSSIITMDPPEHSRLRRLVAKAFTARRVDLLRPRVQRLTDELLDAMVAQGPPVDLVRNVSLPLPIIALCELLGVPTEDRDKVHDWTSTMLSVSGASLEVADIFAARNELWGYIAGLVTERRRTPTDDLIGALVRARDDESRLSETELVDLIGGLLAVGHETTANHLSNMVYTLLTNPEQLAGLRADPELLPSAIDELVRFIPLAASAGFAHVAAEDVELSGVRVRAGEAVFVDLDAANRDGRVFDRAEELDLARKPNPHIGFGHGAHHCLGAQLARLELQVAIGTILTRFPDLGLAVHPRDVVWLPGRRQRGPETLPLTWTVAR